MNDRESRYRILLVKPEGENHLQDLGIDVRKLKWILRKCNVKVWMASSGSTHTQVACCCEYDNELSYSIKGR